MSTRDGFYVVIFKKLLPPKIRAIEIRKQTEVEEAILALCHGDKKKIKHFGYIILNGPISEYRKKIGKTYDRVEDLLT